MRKLGCFLVLAFIFISCQTTKNGQTDPDSQIPPPPEQTVRPDNSSPIKGIIIVEGMVQTRKGPTGNTSTVLKSGSTFYFLVFRSFEQLDQFSDLIGKKVWIKGLHEVTTLDGVSYNYLTIQEFREIN